MRILESGRRFTPYDVANPDARYDEHVIVAAEHVIVDRSYETDSSSEPEYRNSFEAIPSRIPFTPHRATPKPKIEGLQVAVVAGPAGEEIHCDSDGCVKLWFPWQRHRAKKDGSDTTWIRVAQNWAGTGWGGQVIPRIGMEVLVAFLDSDPDRPLITGIVPNPTNKVPYDLPANKTRSTFRSNTHKGAGFNEFTIEDKTDEENMFFHAQKDQTTRILNNRTARIDSHDIYSVGGNRAVEVANNQKHEIGGSMHLTIGSVGRGAQISAERHQQMAAVTAQILREAAKESGYALDIGNYAAKIEKVLLGFFGKDGLDRRNGVIGGPNPRGDAGTALAKSGNEMGELTSSLFDDTGTLNTFVDKFQSDTVGIARVEQIGATKVTNVGKTRHINVGKSEIKTIGEAQETHVASRKVIHVGDTFDIEVGKRFSIKVGSTSIVMDSAGAVTVNAGTRSIVKGGAAQFTIGPGPILYTPVLVQGGSPGPDAPGVPKKTRKPFAEECQLADDA